MDYVQVTGLRSDGRRGDEVRRIQCLLGSMPDCDGSAVLDQGLTRVLACVHGPREAAARSEAMHDRAILRCEVSQAAFSTTERRKRRAGDRRAVAVSNFIEDTFSHVVQTELFHKSQIDITIHILQADGSVLPACINATTLALVQAGIPMRDFVTCCSVGFLDSTLLLDLNHLEESASGPELWLTLMPKSRKILTMKMASSSVRVDEKLLDSLVQEAQVGCQKMHLALKAKVREYVHRTTQERTGDLSDNEDDDDLNDGGAGEFAEEAIAL